MCSYIIMHVNCRWKVCHKFKESEGNNPIEPKYVLSENMSRREAEAEW